jgi:hypothetical protein
MPIITIVVAFKNYIRHQNQIKINKNHAKFQLFIKIKITPIMNCGRFSTRIGNIIRLEPWDKGKFKDEIVYRYNNLDRLTEITGKGYNDKDDKKYQDGLLFDYDQHGNLVKTTSISKYVNIYKLFF